MTSKENLKNWDQLLENIYHYKESAPQASKCLIDGIDRFCEKLRDGNLALANRDINGEKIVVESLIKFFCRTFDPVIESLIQFNSITHTALKFQSLGILPSDNLPKVQLCKKVAFRIEEAILWLNCLEESEFNETVAQNCEDLELFAHLLYSMHLEVKIFKLRWCDLCFRRTKKQPKTIKQSKSDISPTKQTFTYCKEHSYLEAKDNEYRIHLTETIDSKAIFKRENYKPNFHKMGPPTKRNLYYINSKRYRDERRLLGEDFRFNTEDHCKTGLTEHQAIVNIIESTINGPWVDVRHRWDEILNNLTEVQKMVINKPSTHNTWESFSLHVLKKLENRSEETQNPYWFYRMLIDANEWIALGKFKKNKWSKKIETLSLLSKNKNISDKEIRSIFNASNRSISKAYLSKIRAEFIKKQHNNLTGEPPNTKRPSVLSAPTHDV